MTRGRGCSALLIALTLATLAGCATPASSKSPKDPLEPVNRAVYKFNDAVDRAVARPVAKAYRDYVPKPMRTGVSNALDNFAYPTTIVNDLLQAKWKPAINDLGRFLLNSTLGLGGLLDPASRAGLDRNDEDFGQTLGKWGVPSGPYVVLPFYGPSTIRDATMLYPEGYTDVRGYLGDWETKWSLIALGGLDTRVDLLSIDDVLKRAYDPYAFLRDTYLQRREYQVKDGNVEEEPLEEFPDEEPPPDEDSGDASTGDKSGGAEAVPEEKPATGEKPATPEEPAAPPPAESPPPH